MLVVVGEQVMCEMVERLFQIELLLQEAAEELVNIIILLALVATAEEILVVVELVRVDIMAVVVEHNLQAERKALIVVMIKTEVWGWVEIKQQLAEVGMVLPVVEATTAEDQEALLALEVVVALAT